MSMSKTNILFRQVDNSPLIFFRMAFGLLIFLEAWGAIATGWVYRAFIEPQYTFPFIDFSWLQPLPGNGMYFYYIVMGLAGLMVMFGFYYRVGISLYTVMWAGVYFMQKTNYNNHYYLLLLLCILMCFLPAHAWASYDAKRNPKIRSLSCPQWCLWLFVIHITLVYTYASIAKMYPDWLDAKPLAIWFRGKADYILVGDLLQKEWFRYAVAYGGIAFDLLISPGMIWKKTRKYAFAASIFFHLFNSAVFQVGIFPYMGIAWGVFFFNPETIRNLFFKKKPKFLSPENPPNPRLNQKILVYALGAYLVLQLLLPLRHHLFPGNVFWTEEGHRLSWRMMLRAKYGSVNFTIKDNQSDATWQINSYDYLTRKQAGAIATRPDMCWQFVQILKKEFSEKGYEDVSIYANGYVSLNAHPSKPLYKPDYDLAKAEWHRFQSSPWLTNHY